MASLIPQDLYPVAVTILLALLSAATSVIWYFVKDIRAQLGQQQQRQDERIEQLGRDLSEFKASLPHVYVLRDDFVRAVASIDLKIDRLAREVSEMNKGIAKLLGEGAGRGCD